jgi:hypothetical protein
LRLETSPDLLVADTRIVVRRVGDETLLVPVSRGIGDLDSIYMLTDVGTTVWALLARPVTVATIVDAVCEDFDVARDVAAKDVDEFLSALLAKKLVHAATETV